MLFQEGQGGPRSRTIQASRGGVWLGPHGSSAAEAKPKTFGGSFFASVTGCKWTQSRSSGPRPLARVRHGPLRGGQLTRRHFLPERVSWKRQAGCQRCHHIVSVGSGEWPPTSPPCARRTADGGTRPCAWPRHPWSPHGRGHAGGRGQLRPASSPLASRAGDERPRREVRLFCVEGTTFDDQN